MRRRGRWEGVSASLYMSREREGGAVVVGNRLGQVADPVAPALVRQMCVPGVLSCNECTVQDQTPRFRPKTRPLASGRGAVRRPAPHQGRRGGPGRPALRPPTARGTTAGPRIAAASFPAAPLPSRGTSPTASQSPTLP